MINKIAHLSDIHIRKIPTRNAEYEIVFKNLYKSLKKEKPDRIVIVGDLFHDYIDLQGEALILAGSFLNELSKIAPLILTRGNHDLRKKNLKRVDSVKAVVETLQNDNITYYDKTGFYQDDNIMWAVWHHGEPKNNPWNTKDGKKIHAYRNESGYTHIDLFHDPITGCQMAGGYEMKSKSYYKVSDFKGDISMLGDIHLAQYLDKDKTKGYCGSLIAQDFSEGDDKFHGYYLWDVKNLKASEIAIKSDYSFKTIDITPYTDFDDLDFEVDAPTKHMKVRFNWMTLPQSRTKENERKLMDFVRSTHKDVIFSHKNSFLETEDVTIDENVTLENINTQAKQEEIFREYLEKIGAEKEVIEDVITLDGEITSEIEMEDGVGIEWSVVKFGGTDFMSYKQIDIDWRKMDGLFQITGINTAGKTTIMKLMSYILFGKTLETETRMKYGDVRFINNRNGANSCSGYIVIEANGEYFGIKKETKIERTRDGQIKGAPTTLSYYLLANPDDIMNDDNALDKLDSDNRIKTQKKIDNIVGSYDNFMRIVMTTSDTLNRILSNDMATFIDSLLFDSGLDIFDKKLERFKVYQKKVNEKSRVTCNVQTTNETNDRLSSEIKTLEDEITEIETVKLPEIQGKITKGREYVEDLTKKLYKIDDEIYNLDVESTKETITIHEKNIKGNNERADVIREAIKPLKETFDEDRLNVLTAKKDEHKTNEYNRKLEIKELERKIDALDFEIQVINGKIFTLKSEGSKLKDEAITLKESKTCPTCGQALSAEHQGHIDEKIGEINAKMVGIAKEIKNHTLSIETGQNVAIEAHQETIESIKDLNAKESLEMEDILAEIGDLTNDRNDVNKRKELQNELDQIPVLNQNEALNIQILQGKVDNHENSLKQIEENHKIEKGIVAAKAKIQMLEGDETDEKENVFIRKTSIGEKQTLIKNNEVLIAEFKIQEHRDMVMGLYKKCVHRDGIPRQMLSSYVVPKINLTLQKILTVAPFKVWLDVDELRPKLAYANRPDAIIDCISASGKERTFSSVVLKFGLNQINVKSKPTMFLLDEVMGKLDLEGSVEEFVEVLQLIKDSMRKVLVIEQVHEINPDYLIKVELDEDGISSMKID